MCPECSYPYPYLVAIKRNKKYAYHKKYVPDYNGKKVVHTKELLSWQRPEPLICVCPRCGHSWG